MIHTLSPQTLQLAVERLRRGELIGLPTETVYGLAGDARNIDAVSKIFALKGRPNNHPLIVHIAKEATLDDWAIDIPNIANLLREHCWPGPLTFILKKKPSLNTVVTGGHETVAVRSPNHPIAQALLKAFGGGLAAPSANRFCHISPTSAEDVLDEFHEDLDFIIDGGDAEVGIESTIIDLSKPQAEIVRPGFFTAETLSEITGIDIVYATQDQAHAPGNLKKHYAPDTTTYLVNTDELKERIDEHTGVLSFEPAQSEHWIRINKTPEAFAHALYHSLRELDHRQLKQILIEKPPKDSEQWHAVWDRLKRLADDS